ncbi:MAG: M23 family peptidase, partial [Geminicoccaceae bacterium]
MQRAAIFLLSLLMAAVCLFRDQAVAMPQDLLLPLDCEPGRSCWVVRYVDHGPGADTQDYSCGPITGDGHKGTDFAVRDLAAVNAGVKVLAAAGGRVEAVRDGMEDRLINASDVAQVGGRE